MSTPHARLSMISRHLDPRPPISINTPYSIERDASADSPPSLQRRFSSSAQISDPAKSKMSIQATHPTLLIPGPIEFDDAVLQSMSHYRFAIRYHAHICFLYNVVSKLIV